MGYLSYIDIIIIIIYFLFFIIWYIFEINYILSLFSSRYYIVCLLKRNKKEKQNKNIVKL